MTIDQGYYQFPVSDKILDTLLDYKNSIEAISFFES